MYENLRLRVGVDSAGKRLDFFIKEKFPDVSRQNIRRAFIERGILINGLDARKGFILREGDVVHVNRLLSKNEIRYVPNLVNGPRVIYDDGVLAALYKPPFMHTLPARKGENDTLGNFASYMFPSDMDRDFLRPPLFLSRLDFDTSGLVMLAHNKKIFDSVKEMQDLGEIIKTYTFMSTGNLEKELIVKHKIVTTGKGKVRVDKHLEYPDDTYHTRFVPEESYEDCMLLRAKIKKGRMHQIRAHAAFAGIPIVGDVKYGGVIIPAMKGLPARPILHSAAIEFPHPERVDYVRINCPYPEDLIRLMDHFQSNSS